MSVKQVITNYMGEGLLRIFCNLSETYFEEIEEIRIRINQPLAIVHKGTEYFLTLGGKTEKSLANAYKPGISDINKMLELISNFSLYAFEEELRNGYITLPEGHRIGITGKAIVERGRVKAMKNINGFNVRISHEVKGCSAKILNYIIEKEALHTMIISPPGCGKTTLLRDIIRQLSRGIPGKIDGLNIGIADERSEIAGSYQGIIQNDLGPRTDVLDSCPKSEGMMMLLRSMSPAVIAVDEIGSEADVEAISNIINAGVKILCTAHGNSIEDIMKRPALDSLLKMEILERYIILKGRGEIYGIYDGGLNTIFSSYKMEG